MCDKWMNNARENVNQRITKEEKIAWGLGQIQHKIKMADESHI